MVDQPSPNGHWWWDGRQWNPVGPPAPVPTLPPMERSFGRGVTGAACKVAIADGYIEIKGAALHARARVPLSAVEFAVAQRSVVQRGTMSRSMPQLVLFGRGAELGRAELRQGSLRAAEQAAEWINAQLRR